MRVRIHRVKTGYWTPRRLESAYSFLYRLTLRGVERTSRPVLIVLSEKPLRVLLGHIYDEGVVKISLLSRILTWLVYYCAWCGVLRKILPRRMSPLCQVPLDDIARHKRYVATQCLTDILSLLKPFSECGVDVSMLPYTYALRVRDDFRPVIDRLYQDLRSRAGGRIIGIAVVDSDFTLIPRRLRSIALTSRKVYVSGAVNLGFITYLLGRVRSLRRAFIKTPTLVYYTGRRLSLYTLLLLLKRVHRYLRSVYGLNILENAVCLEANSYKTITWSMLSNTVNYPLILVEFLQ